MRRAVLLLLLCFLFAITSPAQTFTNLYNFTAATGESPSASLIQGHDGLFYGTATRGGAYNEGTVFSLTSTGTLGVLHSFAWGGDGAQPYSRLLQANDGLFYGTTPVGGGVGNVIRMTSQGEMTTLLYFCTDYPACANGKTPYAGLIQANDGNLYGTTSQGGGGNCDKGCGTVFSISLGGVLTTLHRFSGTDGAYPTGELVQAKDGNFYGTTQQGGYGNCTNGCGTVFRISPRGTFTTLYKFCAQSDCADGSNPYAALVQANDGNLYGTTYSGGGIPYCWGGCGTIFKITPGGALTTLYRFCQESWCYGGVYPQAGLIQATDGNFYGTALSGGGEGVGTVFRMTPASQLTVLHNFSGNGYGGLNPAAALVQASDGFFYGTTLSGGPYLAPYGTIFKLEVDFNAILSVGKTGSGTVVGGKINCGNTCSAHYEGGDQITLTATPDQGWGLANWSGCDSSQDNVCSVTMNHSRTVTAAFVRTYSLTGSVVGSGVINSNDGKFNNCSTTCSYTYLAGSVVTLAPTAAQGWEFAGWAGCDNVRQEMCWVTMNAGHTVTATFVPTYVVTVSDAGNGTITGGEGHIYCGSACSYSYAKGKQVEFTPIPSSGNTFSGWTGCDKMQGTYCFVTVNSARSISATFSSSSVTLKSLVMNPSKVNGGQLSAGNLTLSGPAPDGGLGVSIASGTPNAAHPPAWIVVPAGKTTASFAVRTYRVKQDTMVNILASTGTSQASATLTVTTSH
jgi:uncharacterized repeat protein (TIGR03803 family)